MGERGVDGAASARVGGEGGQQHPIEAHVPFGGQGGPHESDGDGLPDAPGNEEQSEDGQEPECPGHDEPLGPLDRPPGPRAQQGHRDGTEEDRVAEADDHGPVLGSRHASKEGRREGGGRRERPARPAQLSQVQERVNRSPHARARRHAHEAREDGLSGRDRVAGHLCIEQRLQQDGYRADPEYARAPAGRGGWTKDPVAGAERQSQEDGAGANDAHDVAKRVGRRLGQVRLAPVSGDSPHETIPRSRARRAISPSAAAAAAPSRSTSATLPTRPGANDWRSSSRQAVSTAKPSGSPRAAHTALPETGEDGVFDDVTGFADEEMSGRQCLRVTRWAGARGRGGRARRRCGPRPTGCRRNTR